MKRAAALLFFLAFPTVIFAAAPTRAVIVGLKARSGPLSVKSLSAIFDPTEPSRNFKDLRIANAFAANLTDAEIAELQQSSSVAYVEEDLPRHAFQLTPGALATPLPQVTPYGIDLVHAKQAWVGGKGLNTNVVVMDTGIDFHHPDLAARYAGGLNTVTDGADPLDDNGHGTHCAGIIAAADNDIGVVGVAPIARVWAVKVLDSNGSGKSSNIIRGLGWVVDQKTANGGNWVVSLSLGSCQATTSERTAFKNAIDAGVLIIAAAGNHDPTAADVCTSNNNNSYSVSFPAAYDNVVAVAAVDSNKTVADFSNVGPQVTLAAPGVDVLSTFPLGEGALSLMTSGGSTILAPPVNGTPAKDASGPYVFCGLGNPSDFPASVAGKIALIKRGDLTFHDKSKNAKAAGAIAVVIFNKDTSAISWTLIGKVDSAGKKNDNLCGDPTTANQCHDDPADLAFDWPLTVGIPLADGQALVDHPQSSITINYRTNDDYAIESGTSMSCPHVAGVAATLWSIAPSATASALKQAMISTAHDISDPGIDNNSGNGLVDAEAAGKLLNPGAFGNGSTTPPNKPTGRFPGRRGH